MSELTIRPLHPDDHADWDQLWRDYLAFYETSLPDAARKQAFERLLDPETKLHGRLALLGGQAVGLVHFIYHDHLWRPEGVCYLQDLFTSKAARGAGVGRALIEAVYREADASGSPRVYWLTQDFNHQARALYDKLAKLSPFIKYDRP